MSANMSPFFQTLYHESEPVRYLGPLADTHCSVLRAIVFHDENGKGRAGSDFIFAILWDEKAHDLRILEAIERCYRQGFLSSFIAFATCGKCLHGILAPSVTDDRIS